MSRLSNMYICVPYMKGKIEWLNASLLFTRLVFGELRFYVTTLLWTLLPFRKCQICIFGRSILYCWNVSWRAKKRICHLHPACQRVWTAIIFVYSWCVTVRRRVLLSLLWLLCNLHTIISTMTIYSESTRSWGDTRPQMDFCHLVRKKIQRSQKEARS